MYVSKYNYYFEVKYKSKKEYVLFNALTGEIDIVDKETLKIFDDIKNGQKINNYNEKTIEKFKNKGYLVKDENYQKQISTIYDYFKKSNLQKPRLYDLIITYSCNLRCPYCYVGSPNASSELRETKELISRKMLNKAFDTYAYLNEKNPSNPYLYLTGGEPLLKRKVQKEVIFEVLKTCNDNNYRLRIATNGVDLIDYCDMIAEYDNVHVDITLDGTKEIHNQRRIFANGKGTFDKIEKGIDYALNSGIKVLVHINLDKQNINSLPELAKFMINKGWRDEKNFIAYPNRVHDEENCYPYTMKLPDIFRKLFDFYTNNKETKIFHLETWSELGRMELYPIMYNLEKMYFQKLFFNDKNNKKDSLTPAWLANWTPDKYKKSPPKIKPYLPRFTHCGACNPSYSLDLYGDIYTCGSYIGRKEFRVGRYYPDLKIDTKILNKWANRDILHISKCKECTESLFCGGGCGIAAMSQNKDLYTPVCPSMKDILQVAFEYYLPQFKKISKEINLTLSANGD